MKAKTIAILALFTVLLAVAIALAQGYPITITSVQIKDLNGYTRTTFNRGEVVVIETTLYGNPSYYYTPRELSYLEIVEVFWTEKNWVMSLLLTRDTIKTGETKTFGGGYKIRDNDPTGNYLVKVFVWNGFPSEVGAAWAPLAEMKTKSFKVNP